MRGFSKAIITGNITRDPEMRTTPSGATVCSFSVAVNRSFRGADGNQQDSVSFFDCSAWGKLGETIAQYAKKGSAVLVSGRLEQHSWDDKASGQKRSRVEIVVEDFNFLGGRNDGSDSDGGSRSYGGGYGGNQGGQSGNGGAKNSNKGGENFAQEENVPEDIPAEVDLGDIPF